MATILLVGVDLFFRGKLEALLPGHHLVTSDSVDPPDLVIADIARVEPEEVVDAWPDVPEGLRGLRQRCRIAPCSNGNISLMVDLARRNGFPWDAILGAELARDYKPKATVYLAAAAAFDLAPEETLMAAAHSDDLAAAAAAGLDQTALVNRIVEVASERRRRP